MVNNSTYKYLPLTKTALLCSIAIVLSALENMLPQIPFLLPGMKLGLSNIVIVFALETVSFPCALVVVLFKGIFALITRGLIAAVMSVCGSLLSCIAMFFMLKIKRFSFGYIGVTVIGAFFHNFAQLLVSFIIIGQAVFSYMPVLCISSVVTGIITGTVVGVIIQSIKNAVKV